MENGWGVARGECYPAATLNKLNHNKEKQQNTLKKKCNKLEKIAKGKSSTMLKEQVPEKNEISDVKRMQRCKELSLFSCSITIQSSKDMQIFGKILLKKFASKILWKLKVLVTNCLFQIISLLRCYFQITSLAPVQHLYGLFSNPMFL